MSLLQCKDVSMGYEGKTMLQNINFQVNEGDYLCIVGENGSGKSTLLKGLLRLKSLAGGEIILGDGLLQKEIGYLPQRLPSQKNFPASVYEIVLSGRLNQLGWRPFYTKEDKRIVRERMEWMGIWHLKKESFSVLSGGQQQRVMLARALCATSKLLVLDEPVTGLDPIVTKEMYDLILRINR
ncbi:MAG: metal ABC transporter ATP-binding protein, partial [Lachnospiraceae bacterium]|nr:metal ABC transporter ATP-binding protein [Lachnospiraceae bacterium]